jgi:hypothetical protein
MGENSKCVAASATTATTKKKKKTEKKMERWGKWQQEIFSVRERACCAGDATRRH